MLNVKTQIENRIANTQKNLLKEDYAYARMSGQFRADLSWMATLIDIYGSEDLKKTILDYFPE